MIYDGEDVVLNLSLIALVAVVSVLGWLVWTAFRAPYPGVQYDGEGEEIDE
jgi:hypothetical protein